EGGSTFFHNMTQVIDGHTGIEHSIPIPQVYEDVVKLWGNTKVGYTPTLIVAYGGIWGENYWYDKTNVWENKKLLTFTPRAIIDERSRRRVKAPEEEYGHLQNTKACSQIAKAGTKVNLGAHGQLQGLGVHWELWMLQQGGMTNLEALRCGTQNGADYIGMGDALGSLSVGKLADLVILDKNPLENIQNSEAIRYVMKNGRLYDATTMNEIGNYDKKRPKFFWEDGKSSLNFEWHEDTHSFEHGKCSCGAH
ncbi:MAG: amidohydrolase family protein, partial [Bacteroidia bacterium]